MKRLSLLLALAIWLCSCGQNTVEQPSPPAEITALETPSVDSRPDSLVPPPSAQLEIATAEIVDEGLAIQSLDEVGYFLSNLNSFNLEARFETSISIHGEGPHCDLLDWKHGYSPWKDIKDQLNESGHMTETPEIPQDISAHFPQIPFAEVKQRIREHCGEAWYSLIKDAKKIDNKIVEVGASKVLFRATGIRKDNSIQTTRIFSLSIPMGC